MVHGTLSACVYVKDLSVFGLLHGCFRALNISGLCKMQTTLLLYEVCGTLRVQIYRWSAGCV